MTSWDSALLQFMGLFFAHLRSQSGVDVIQEQSLVNPDVITFQPEGSYYKVKEEVRQQILHEASLSPVVCLKKSLMITECQRLRAESANSLLKVIEEPTKHINFILLSNNPEDVIPTIKSRCIEIQLQPISESLIKELVDETDLKDFYKYTKNNFGLLLDYKTNYREVVTILENIAANIQNGLEINEVYESATLLNQAVTALQDVLKEKNATRLVEYKQFVKDSKLSSSFVKRFEENLHREERRVKRNALVKICEVLSYHFPQFLEVITEYKNRLVFNPNEALFVESLLLSIAKGTLI